MRMIDPPSFISVKAFCTVSVAAAPRGFCG
jgi:hypothetical protein